MDFSARGLAAGKNETPYLPFGHFASLGRSSAEDLIDLPGVLAATPFGRWLSSWCAASAGRRRSASWPPATTKTVRPIGHRRRAMPWSPADKAFTSAIVLCASCATFLLRRMSFLVFC
jgi:hypothetical protein